MMQLAKLILPAGSKSYLLSCCTTGILQTSYFALPEGSDQFVSRKGCSFDAKLISGRVVAYPKIQHELSTGL